MLVNLIAVGIGGALGSMARFGISLWLAPRSGAFPWATLTANVLACVVMGFAYVGFMRKGDVPPAWQFFVLSGFCGGFSTFSTFSLELFRMLEQGRWPAALLYVAVSVGACLLALALVMRTLRA